MCPGCGVALALHHAQQPALLGLIKDAEVVDQYSVSSPTSPLPEPEDEGPLYEARRKIYPQRVSGTFRRVKWAVVALTLAIYYLLPFVRWDRGPNAPGQAVLV